MCRRAKTLLLSEKGPGVYCSQKNGSTVVLPALSEAKRLRRKIYKHRDSQAHTRSVEIAQMREKERHPTEHVHGSTVSQS